MAHDLQTKAARLLALHQGPRILVLANAWDAASARIVELAGFPAVASTSAGIAFSLGYPDGQKIPRSMMLQAVERITEAVAVPVTADMEAGYHEQPDGVGDTGRQVLLAGAVGLNFEDSTRDPARPLLEVAPQVERIRALREAGNAAGVHLVINARTDVFLRGVGEASGRLAEAIRRGNAYREAGADCVFVPGVSDAATIGRLVKEISAPVNILGTPGCPPLGELERLGVRRVSLGSGPMRAGLGLLRRLTKELLESGTYTGLADAIPGGELNKLMERK